MGRDARLEMERAVPDDLWFEGRRRVRVYWNLGSAAPYFWSFDFGDASTERYVLGFESEVPVRSNQTGKKEPWPNPSGWLEAEGYVAVHEGRLFMLKQPAQSRDTAA